MLLTVAVVAVAVVVVVALLVTGALPGLGPGSGGSTGDALSFSAAHSMANSAAAGVSGGPWSLYGAEGIDVTTPAPYSLGVPNGIGSFESIHYLASARPGVPADGSPLTSG
ncbi:MAG: hypothetical protein ACREDE_04810, partial [Thermoplasmata archaeon]